MTRANELRTVLPSQVQSAELNKMVQRGQLFNARMQPQNEVTQLSTGYQCLDQALAGGLSVGHLHEVQVPCLFCGESLMFQAAVKRAACEQQPIFWLNPPAQPFMQGLHATGAQHLVLANLAEDELQWSASQILRELKRGVVLIWHPRPSAQIVRAWQRALQPASDVFALVISQHMAQEARAYNTRIRLLLQSGKISFDILKRPGGWPLQTPLQPLQPWPV